MRKCVLGLLHYNTINHIKIKANIGKNGAYEIIITSIIVNVSVCVWKSMYYGI